VIGITVLLFAVCRNQGFHGSRHLLYGGLLKLILSSRIALAQSLNALLPASSRVRSTCCRLS